jgi:predicted nucleic acid-binding protein
MIVLDAGVVIGHLRPDDLFHRAATEFLEEHEELEWGVGALTLAECLVGAVTAGQSADLMDKITRLSILRFDLSAADALALAETRAATRLKMPDALVLYTAERSGAELVTTDRSLAQAADARGVTAHLLEA